MFKLNDLTSVAQFGLATGECLVNDTPERLKTLGVNARPTANPATGQPNSITSLEHKRELESRGLTTWDQMEYLILSFAAALRRNGASFVDGRFTKAQLQRLGAAFPALIETVQSIFSVQQITAVLRALAAEELSIRNLRSILERLLDYQSHKDAASDESEELNRIVTFVRIGIKREISRKFPRDVDACRLSAGS